ncbi:MAG: extracellular matrix regulator RemB [Ruthenibacterium lactatiformans]
MLSLKLAEAAGAQKITGEHPVMLLDDVLSELDETRQSYLLSRMEHRQTIVTACDPDLFRRTSGRVYRMEGGIRTRWQSAAAAQNASPKNGGFMYLHLGQESIVRTRDILGIFDLDTASLSRHTRDYLAAAEKAGRVVTVTGELPKSFIVTTGESPAVYISQISAGTLKKRSGYVDGISNIEK